MELHPITLMLVEGMRRLPVDRVSEVVIAAVRHHGRGPGKDLDGRIALNAAKDAHLERTVRDALRPRAEELKVLGAGIAVGAASVTVIGGRYIESAHKLTDEEFEGFFAGYRAVGIEVPPRRELLS